ncbi:MAG: hypothetical protein SPI21_03135 [Hungatella hathewayi]|uniref:hypothetical protein n=1 Tax=Hungatella TaxID=1649459 RepID=UPI0011058395|nr:MULTISPECIES: hypothetical protein [Hungatella]MCI7380781.1 hypothetical protein [Hungatella sp.]MDY6235775.1 hypothetical protein [Hungatella hathewayi]
MTIFNSYSTLAGFEEFSEKDLSLHSFLRSVCPLRKKLDAQGYLLDAYLSAFFDLSSYNMTYEAADDGLTAMSRLHQICRFAVDQNPPDDEDLPIYSKASQLLNTLPSLQERDTTIGLLILELADDFLASSLTQYLEQSEEKLRSYRDFYKLTALYERLSDMLGEAPMEQLNQELKTHFLIAPISAVFIQSFLNELLHRLDTADMESSHKYFQLILDSMQEEA